MTARGHATLMAVHRYSGLAMLLFLGFAALTGSLLVFMRPLDRALNADLFGQPVATSTMPVASVVDGFRAAHPEYEVQSFPLAVGPGERIPVKVAPTGGIDQLFLDRATGALAGSRSDKPALDRRGAAELLHDVHYTLMLGTGGRWFMGLVAVAWTVSTLVGAWLTFPLRGPFWKHWKRTWKFSFRSVFARQMLDWHRASGLWLFVPLLLLCLTSVALNFFGEAYAPMVEAIAPEAAPPAPGPSTRARDFAGAVADARAMAPRLGLDWQPATVLLDAAENRIGVTLTDDGVLNYRRLGPVYLWFDAASGRLVEMQDPYHGDRRLALYRLLYPVHSGRIAGWASQALVFVSGLATFGLCVTGVYLWWKRRPMRKRPRRRA